MSVRKRLRRGSVTALAALVCLTPLSAAEIGTSARVDHAVTYIAGHQEPDGHFPSSFGTAHASTADAVVSLVAAGKGGKRVERAMDWLEDNVAGADNIGKKAKVVMAAVASGRDPRDFGGDDLVADIEQTLGGDEIYDSSPFSQVYDQALAILALAAAGENVPRRALKWLADAQCPDGGWQFDQPRLEGENNRCRSSEKSDFTETDTNTTALVMQALAAVPRSVPLDKDPFRWLQNRRDPVRRGWGFDRTFFLTDSASTSIVLQAYTAYGRKRPQDARKALRFLQRYCTKADLSGGFSRGWEETDNGYRRARGQDLGNSVVAVLGLLEKPLPIKPKPFLKPLPKALSCDPVD